MNACYRGCRLYSICQFVSGNAGFNSSREECQGGESVRRTARTALVVWAEAKVGVAEALNLVKILSK